MTRYTVVQCNTTRKQRMYSTVRISSRPILANTMQFYNKIEHNTLSSYAKERQTSTRKATSLETFPLLPRTVTVHTVED